MKKITTFLMVLITAMGVKAQTEPVTTVYDFEDGNALFVADSRITTSVVDALGFDGSKAVLFKCAGNAQNGYSFAHYDFSSLVGNPKTIEISFQYYNANGGRAILSIGDANVRGNHGNSTKMTYSNKGAIFALGSNKNYALINGTSKGLSVFCNKWLDVSVTINVIDKNYSYTIKESSNSQVLASAEDIAYYSSDALECTQIDLFGCINNNECARIDNISITVTQDVREYADYTVVYVNEKEEIIKEEITNNGAVGDAIVLADDLKLPFMNSDNTMKYFYKSDDSEGKTIAADGSTEVTMIFREAETWSYTVNAVDGESNVIKELAAASAFEGEIVKVPYNKYILVGDVLYNAAPVGSEFNKSVTMSSNGIIATVEYTVVPDANVVYFSEAEEIEGLTVYEDGFTNIRMSNGVAAYATDLTTITTLPAGVYTLESSSRAGNTTFYAGTSEVLVLTSTGSVVTPISEEFTLYEPTDIKVSAGNNKNYFDYVLINRTGDVLTITDGTDFAGTGAYNSATYTPAIEAGVFGTICLPFTPDAASLENYSFFAMSSEGEGVLNFTQVEAPVANTPYIYCLNDGKEVTAITGGATVVSSTINNVTVGVWSMAGSFTNQTIDASADEVAKYYGLVAAQNKIVKANKNLVVKPYRAYFTAPKSASAMMLRITRDGETTEIAPADLDVQPTNVIYDITGRRVEKMEKGIYIVNGKKVIR